MSFYFFKYLNFYEFLFIILYTYVVHLSMNRLLSYAYIGPVRLDEHPRTYVQPIDGAEDEAMLRIVEGKLVRITHDVPTLRMERIPITMQEHVVGVPPSWLCLL